MRLRQLRLVRNVTPEKVRFPGEGWTVSGVTGRSPHARRSPSTPAARGAGRLVSWMGTFRVRRAECLTSMP